MPRTSGAPRAQVEGPATPLGFETLLADLSSRFINLPPGQVDHEIEESLQRVCAMLALDLGVLWQWDADGARIEPTHAFPPLGALPRPFDDTGDAYPWAVREVRGGRAIVVSSLNVEHSVEHVGEKQA